MKLELPRGMRDLEQEELYNINYIEERFLETATLFNFKIMEPSPIEMLSTLETKSGIISQMKSIVLVIRATEKLHYDLILQLD